MILHLDSESALLLSSSSSSSSSSAYWDLAACELDVTLYLRLALGLLDAGKSPPGGPPLGGWGKGR